MAPPKTYTWISIWFILSHAIDAWDIAYILLRPHSLPGSKYRWIWKPYDDLEVIDMNYNLQYFYDGHIKSTGLAAKAILSIPEVLFALTFLYKSHVSRSSSAPLYGFTSAMANILKCALWSLEEVSCNWCTVGHNDHDGFLRAFVVPMSIWTTLSILSAWRFWKDITIQLESPPATQKSVSVVEKPL